MKDGVIRKVNSCFNSERVRTGDCSLEVTTESFRIGKVRIEKASLGDTRQGQISKSGSFFKMSSTK